MIKCACCKKELDESKFSKINRGNEVEYFKKCKKCMNYEMLSRRINEMSKRRERFE